MSKLFLFEILLDKGPIKILSNIASKNNSKKIKENRD